jgi:hypothetical protein
MFTQLNASGYDYNGIFYNAEFEDILSKIIACYNTMISENVSLSNNENKIRDYMLYNYLKKQSFKVEHSVTNYLFDPELPENGGRIDIRIMPVNPFVNDDAYYIIECKRLDAVNQNGTSGLNSEYIKEGVSRFVSSKYSTHYKTNGMIGFVVDPIDINQNVSSINNLLATSFLVANTTQDLQFRKIVADFDFSYCSCHNVEGNSVVLYHLMFDLSKNVT